MRGNNILYIDIISYLMYDLFILYLEFLWKKKLKVKFYELRIFLFLF